MPATLPICVALIARRISNKSLLKQFFRYQTLVITFVAYAAFHASQKPFSVYKVIMLDTCTNASYGTKNCTMQCCGYAPFNAKNGKALLGLLDAIFVGPNAMGLLITSEIMDRLNPRYCIVVGCYFTAFFTLVVGLSFTWKIHDYAFYVTAVFLNGLAQSAAWPVVLSAATSWFDKEQRKGLAFRIWNSHVYVGILVGLLVSGAFVESSLSLSFIIPGSLVAGIGIILFLSLVPHPDPLDQLSDAHNIRRMTRTTPSMQEVPSWFQAKNALEFRVAMRLPGVVEFALGLFFSRMVSYTLSAWLPYYIHATTKLGARPSAFYSVFFTCWSDWKISTRAKWKNIKKCRQSTGEGSSYNGALTAESERLLRLLGWIKADGDSGVQEAGIPKEDYATCVQKIEVDFWDTPVTQSITHDAVEGCNESHTQASPHSPNSALCLEPTTAAWTPDDLIIPDHSDNKIRFGNPSISKGHTEAPSPSSNSAVVCLEPAATTTWTPDGLKIPAHDDIKIHISNPRSCFKRDVIEGSSTSHTEPPSPSSSSSVSLEPPATAAWNTDGLKIPAHGANKIHINNPRKRTRESAGERASNNLAAIQQEQVNATNALTEAIKQQTEAISNFSRILNNLFEMFASK